jgi:hypothetical protein
VPKTLAPSPGLESGDRGQRQDGRQNYLDEIAPKGVQLAHWLGVFCPHSELEASMLGWAFAVPIACVVAIALLAFYVPTIYIRKTNKMIQLLEQIATNTRK